MSRFNFGHIGEIKNVHFGDAEVWINNERVDNLSDEELQKRGITRADTDDQ